ncbi:zinc finger protein 235-like [Ctenocephalides felis]|uniref:zinc finger protein 235-like n=1 Tax=Ctenocephalides felis TaxID=7515 RepID=UPI000E6E5904|nr:zinc finger protein 235-like [Ctenocephalides felis]
MEIDVIKLCRVCLEDGATMSLFSTDFAVMPSHMMWMCAKIKVLKDDGMPPSICNNCIYRLGVAYHFLQQCENSDARLRHFLGLEMRKLGQEVATMTDEPWPTLTGNGSDENSKDKKAKKTKTPKRTRYKRKAPDECKKRGPKTLPKVPQTCYECQKTFKCAAQLQMHIRTHTGERPFACTYCTRRFAQKHNLAIHIRTHTGEKPFQCEICSKQFSALGNFQAHQKIHKGIRDQVCPVCNKGFITPGDLSRHMVTHTGIKNHHCDICGKSFSRGRDMMNHKKKVHLGEQISNRKAQNQQNEQRSENVIQPPPVHQHQPVINHPLPIHQQTTNLPLQHHNSTTLHHATSLMPPLDKNQAVPVVPSAGVDCLKMYDVQQVPFRTQLLAPPPRPIALNIVNPINTSEEPYYHKYLM